MKLVFADESKTVKVIGFMKSQAKGVDGLSINMIKYSISPFLTHTVNYAIGHNFFLDLWNVFYSTKKVVLLVSEI